MKEEQRARLGELAEIRLECLPEDMPIRGNALASGDSAEDRRAEDDIIRQLDDGNPWAWCTVKVTATFHGFSGVDYLGCCSYASKEDFRQPGGYFEDMRNQAIDELARELDGAEEALRELAQG